MQLKRVKTEDVYPSEGNPRRDFGDLDALAASFALNPAHPGEPMTPPLLVQDGGVYRIVDGERRWRAMRKAGTAEFDAVVCEDWGDARAGMGALDADQVEFWVRRVMGRSDPLEAVRLFVRRVVVDRAAGTLTAEFTFDKKKEPPPDGPGRGSRKYLGAGLWRLTANTSIYALPCGFAVVGESPRLAR